MQYYRGHRILDAVLDSMLAAGLTKAKTLARGEQAPGQRKLSFDQPTITIPMHGMAECDAISEL